MEHPIVDVLVATKQLKKLLFDVIIKKNPNFNLTKINILFLKTFDPKSLQLKFKIIKTFWIKSI